MTKHNHTESTCNINSPYHTDLEQRKREVSINTQFIVSTKENNLVIHTILSRFSFRPIL